ncbi:MAG: bifunctional phosphopantothenoylcysteine decarboxylase/phosphopantothenate synthase [Candidatus Kapabacteria bacterium]|nr:bifunctional phosphopantothenoylcysteine decarboxylase/phosphopantothenate synthase [Candidatus Kapabacteria bacterium]
MSALKNYSILLGVTGSISAYKSPLIVRECVKRGADVHVVLTPSATQFVTPLVLQNVSKNSIAVSMFDDRIQENGSWHIHKARECSIMLIAPCSAKTLSSLASGYADTALNCIALALPRETPLVIAPAMDTDMWNHPSVQRNIRQLQDDGVIIIQPESGELASGLYGVGRLPEPHTIVDIVERVLNDGNPKHVSNPTTHDTVLDRVEAAAYTSSNPLHDAVEADALNAEIAFAELRRQHASPLYNKRVLISAGSTHEAIDGVRYIANHSTGKMGVALAEAAYSLGADVTLVHGPLSVPLPQHIRTISVQSAGEMYDAIQGIDYDVAILAAAVADYTPAEPISGKIKKADVGSELMLRLVKTKDILAKCGATKSKSQYLVGFALEAENLHAYAEKKLREKNCDMIIANSANTEQSGFGVDVNTVSVLQNHNGQIRTTDIPTMTKRACADRILSMIAEDVKNRS